MAIFSDPKDDPNIRYIYWPRAWGLPIPIAATFIPLVYLQTLCAERLVRDVYAWRGFDPAQRIFLLSFITSSYYQPTFPLFGVVMNWSKFTATIVGVGTPLVIAGVNAMGPQLLAMLSVDPASPACDLLTNVARCTVVS